MQILTRLLSRRAIMAGAAASIAAPPIARTEPGAFPLPTQPVIAEIDGWLVDTNNFQIDGIHAHLVVYRQNDTLTICTTERPRNLRHPQEWRIAHFAGGEEMLVGRVVGRAGVA